MGTYCYTLRKSDNIKVYIDAKKVTVYNLCFSHRKSSEFDIYGETCDLRESNRAEAAKSRAKRNQYNEEYVYFTIGREPNSDNPNRKITWHLYKAKPEEISVWYDSDPLPANQVGVVQDWREPGRKRAQWRYITKKECLRQGIRSLVNGIHWMNGAVCSSVANNKNPTAKDYLDVYRIYCNLWQKCFRENGIHANSSNSEKKFIYEFKAMAERYVSIA